MYNGWVLIDGRGVAGQTELLVFTVLFMMKMSSFSSVVQSVFESVLGPTPNLVYG